MIQVNLFTSSTAAGQHYGKREFVTKAALSEFFKIKDENKSKVILVIYFQSESEHIWKDFVEKNADSGMQIYFAPMPTDEYIQKVQLAHQTDCEYSCKWDDDSFVSRHMWDYMIENVSILADDAHSVLLPTLSNGIPSVEFFVDDILPTELQQEAHKIFLEDKVLSIVWGYNYDIINQNIAQMESWDVINHWKVVDEHYKGKPMGVHPARFSYRYNKLAMEYICENPQLVLDKRDYQLEKNFYTPYFCNNIFIAKSDFYRDSQKLFFDHWDEGQLNDLGKLRGQTPVFVRNGFGIHMAYGCTQNQQEIEAYYMENFYHKHFQFE